MYIYVYTRIYTYIYIYSRKIQDRYPKWRHIWSRRYMFQTHDCWYQRKIFWVYFMICNIATFTIQQSSIFSGRNCGDITTLLKGNRYTICYQSGTEVILPY